MTDSSPTPFDRILALLDEQGARYRVIEHEPEGRTVEISRIRGNSLGQALNSIVVMVKIGKKERRYYLANVPGDRRVDLNAVRDLCQGTYAMLAPLEKVAELTHSVAGAVPPFSFHPDLEIIADPAIQANEEVVFNAGRLDRSIFMRLDEYLRVARPRLVPIAQRAEISE